MRFQWETMTDFAKKLLFKMGAMPSYDFIKVVRGRDDYIDFLKNEYRVILDNKYEDRYSKLAIQLNKLLSIQPDYKPFYLFNVNEHDSLNYKTIHFKINFLPLPLSFSYSVYKNAVMNHSNLFEFGDVVVDYIVDHLFTKHIDEIKNNLRTEVIEYLRKIESQILNSPPVVQSIQFKSVINK